MLRQFPFGAPSDQHLSILQFPLWCADLSMVHMALSFTLVLLTSQLTESYSTTNRWSVFSVWYTGWHPKGVMKSVVLRSIPGERNSRVIHCSVRAVLSVGTMKMVEKLQPAWRSSYLRWRERWVNQCVRIASYCRQLGLIKLCGRGCLDPFLLATVNGFCSIFFTKDV